jgi:hypothetical protein
MMLTVAAHVALIELRMTRWHNPGNEPFAHACGATMHDEATFDAFAIPRAITADWHYGTDGWPEGRSSATPSTTPTTADADLLARN